jgi:hypothetical protein
MTPALVALSMARNGHQLTHQRALGNPAVCPEENVLTDLAGRTARMQALLQQLYGRWTAQCR